MFINGDCLDVLKDYPDNYFDLVLTDPPYGIGESGKNHKTRSKAVSMGCGKKFNSGRIVDATDYGDFHWDMKLSREHIEEIRRVSKNQIIFGGNYYADWLPASPCWIIWDKKNGKSDFADCEMAWTSFKSATRIFRFKWNGMLQEDMKHKEKRVYPTQKPKALFRWILDNYSEPGDKICDPCCGSGTTISACTDVGIECIGIDKIDNSKIIQERALLDTPRLFSF